MSNIPLELIQAMENSPDELKQKIAELLNCLYSSNTIDKELFDYFNPYLIITDYRFNTLNIFKELLAILSVRTEIKMNDYRILKIFILTKGISINVDNLSLRQEDKHFLDVYKKYKIN